MADDLRAAYKRRFENTIEPERYEIVSLLEELTPDRRAFLKAFGGGVCFLVTVRAQDRDVPVRVHVAPDGTAHAFTGKMEMGQGARTLLTQAFAEELGLDVHRVQLVMGDTALCPDDGGTWGSLTTPQTVPVIRKAAAAVRAATTGGDPPLTRPAAWRTLGRSVPQIHSRAIVTGAKVYPSDFRVHGMRHAVVVRPPHHRAAVTTVDATAAERMAGVRIVRDGDLLAAVADDPATARRAAGLVQARWAPEPVPPPAEWAALFKKTAVAPALQPAARYPPLLVRGDVAEALRTATRTRSSTYWLDPIAHVPLEPRAAVAVWEGDRVTVYGGVQAPFLVRQEVARALGIPPAQVRIVASDSGGGFGGKQRGECEIEAARLARIVGTPVRVAWTREEEFTCSYSRPPGLVEVESGVDGAGRLVALRFGNYNSGGAGLAPQYDIPHHWVGFYRTATVVRQGSYRSLAAVANNFALETHMDEWAADLGVDPVAFRLRHVTDARLRDVVERTAERFGWSRGPTGRGRGIGISCNLEKDARLALCVEVEATGPEVRVLRMAATGDFGAALNPDLLRNQMTGAIVQGLGGALWERVRFEGTTQVTRHLSHYRVPRFRDLPAMDVALIDRRDVEPAGAGESPITLTAPAVGSAIFQATGARRRTLPFIPAS